MLRREGHGKNGVRPIDKGTALSKVIKVGPIIDVQESSCRHRVICQSCQQYARSVHVAAGKNVKVCCSFQLLLLISTVT